MIEKKTGTLEIDEKMEKIYQKIQDLEENNDIDSIHQITDPLYDRIKELEKQKKEFLTVINEIKLQLKERCNKNIELSEYNELKNRILREDERLTAALPIYAHKSEIIQVFIYNF